LLRTWFKYAEKELHRPKARCYLNGKKVAEAKVERKQKEVTYRSVRKPNDSGKRETWEHQPWGSDRLMGRYRAAARLRPDLSV
jgi:hypothetical protein